MVFDMKNRKLRRILALSLTFALVISTIGLGANMEQELRRETDCVYTMQEKALNAWNVLWELFEICEEGFTTYTNDFAGGWINGRNLHIALTSGRAEWWRYKELLSDFECIVIFETAEYSLNDLNIARNFVSGRLQEAGHKVTAHFVSESDNRIVLEILDLDSRSEAEVRTALSDVLTENQTMTSMPANDCNGSRGLSEIALEENMFVLEFGEFVERTASLVGGLAMQARRRIGTSNTFNAVANLTSGSNGTWGSGNNVVRGFIVAGHSLMVGDRIHQHGLHVGDVHHVTYGNNQRDFAFVRTNTNAILTNQVRDTATSVKSITTFTNTAPEGTTVRSFGAVSGQSQAIVRARGITFICDEGITTIGAVRTRINQGTVVRGDSGGSVFIPTSDINVRFTGVVIGQNRFLLSRYMYYTCMGQLWHGSNSFVPFTS
jgi:hypothetical protein